jgi:hypothetical protein
VIVIVNVNVAVASGCGVVGAAVTEIPGLASGTTKTGDDAELLLPATSTTVAFTRKAPSLWNTWVEEFAPVNEPRLCTGVPSAQSTVTSRTGAPFAVAAVTVIVNVAARPLDIDAGAVIAIDGALVTVTVTVPEA